MGKSGKPIQDDWKKYAKWRLTKVVEFPGNPKRVRAGDGVILCTAYHPRVIFAAGDLRSQPYHGPSGSPDYPWLVDVVWDDAATLEFVHFGVPLSDIGVEGRRVMHQSHIALTEDEFRAAVRALRWAKATREKGDSEPRPRRSSRIEGRKEETLGHVLEQMGLLTAEQLAQALEIQRRTGEILGQILIGMKVITDGQLAQAMSKQSGYRYVSLTAVEIDPDAVNLIPHPLALRLRVIPLTWERGRLVVAMTNPNDVVAVDDVRLMTGQEVEPVITTEDDLLAAIRRYYQGGELR